MGASVNHTLDLPGSKWDSGYILRVTGLQDLKPTAQVADGQHSMPQAPSPAPWGVAVALETLG